MWKGLFLRVVGEQAEPVAVRHRAGGDHGRSVRARVLLYTHLFFRDEREGGGDQGKVQKGTQPADADVEVAGCPWVEHRVTDLGTRWSWPVSRCPCRPETSAMELVVL